MTLVLLLTLALAAQSQAPRDKPAPAGPQNGVIEGRVIVQDSKPVVPVRRARVSLTGERLAQPEVTDTDTDGRYRFTQLPAGAYRVTVSKPGFVTLEAGATQPGQRPPAIELKDAATTTANVALPRGASIEGRVQNDAGEPLEGVIVSAVRFRPATLGLGRFVIRETRSDDLGRYRLHSLAPGAYFVEATPDPRRADEGASATGERLPGVARTFFPGTAQVHEARRITLARGQEVSGTDLVVLRVPTVRVGGKIVDSTGKPVPASLRLRPVSGLPLSIGGGILPDGSFQLSSVPPGEVLAAGLSPDGSRPRDRVRRDAPQSHRAGPVGPGGDAGPRRDCAGAHRDRWQPPASAPGHTSPGRPPRSRLSSGTPPGTSSCCRGRGREFQDQRDCRPAVAPPFFTPAWLGAQERVARWQGRHRQRRRDGGRSATTHCHHRAHRQGRNPHRERGGRRGAGWRVPAGGLPG